MSELIAAYPLQWPSGWRRTVTRERTDAKFMHAGARLTIAVGADRVYRQLNQFGVGESTVVISSDLRTRLDGRPYSDQGITGIDPGVAVYWRDRGTQRCMAVDRYIRIADNLGAVAATIEAMRAIERHGGAMILDRAFMGFAALPAPVAWWEILRLTGPNVSREQIERAHRRLAADHHPDLPGGNNDLMADINRARDIGLECVQ